MALKRKTTPKKEPVKKNESRLSEIEVEIKETQEIIKEQQDKLCELRKERLSIEIAPFKIGGYAMAEVNAGKSKKVQKCLLECESGTLYIRPVKEDGELSGRHFSLVCVNGDYSNYLKPVEE